MSPIRNCATIFLKILLIILLHHTEASEYIYHSYQRSITCTSQHSPREPGSISEIQDIVRYAIAHNVNVKVIGHKHSISDSICTSGIPVILTNITHFSYDLDSKLATVGAGAEVGDLLEKLHQYGRTISGAPSFGGITVGGAIGTGAHGTGINHPSSLSDQIVSVTVVDGRGKVRKITKDDEDFKAFRVNLGLLGIVYELELATQPQYKLCIRHFPVDDFIFRNGTDIVEMAKAHDHFQFWWFPTNKQVILAVGSRVPVHVPGNCETRFISEMPWLTSNAFSTVIETFQKARDDLGLFYVQAFAKMSLYREVPGRDAIFVEDDGETPCLHGTAIGYSHRMTSNKCVECFWETEGKSLRDEDGNVAIPLNKLMPAMRTLGEIFSKQLVQFPLNGIYVRFLARGDAYMAMNDGDMGWASIEWITVPRWDRSQPKIGLSAYQAMGQVLVEQYGGRPHWGKNGLYYSNPEIIRKSHPNLDKFIAAMNKYDPNELFMNTFGERIKHGRSRVTVSSDLAEHCAMHEVCVCKTDNDCGNEGPLDYTCGRFLGFPRYNVCLPGTLEIMKGAYSRSVIDLMATLEYSEDSAINYLRQYKIMKNVSSDSHNTIQSTIEDMNDE